MSRSIIITVICGILFGYFVVSGHFAEAYMVISEKVLIVGLCVLMLSVGLDIGMQGTVVANFKKVGWRILVIPFAAIAGTLAACAAAALFLPLSFRESMAVGAGFGWYSLAPLILIRYSSQISALSFIHNILRELFGIILIPAVAKKIGYVEACAVPGAAAMDVCLPIVEKETNADIAVYSFVTGVIMSIAVPVLVPLIAGIL